MTCSTQIYGFQLTPIKVSLGWVKKVETINARDKKIFKVLCLSTQKEIKRDIYYRENTNLTYLLITEASTGGIL